MSENLRNYTQAIYTMDAVVNRVPADRWDAQSPCEQWTAKEVVGHCLYALHAVAAYTGAREKPAEMPEAERAGADPATIWAAARDEVLAALDQDGVLDTEVDGPFGRGPIDNALPVMTMDLTTHTWDLAKATGQDAVIPRDLAVAAYEGIKGFGDGARRPGLFADEVQVGDDADIVTKMAAMAGRQV